MPIQPDGSEARALTRRTVLQAGVLGLAASGSASLPRSGLAADSGSADTACLLVLLGGGPSHLDTYDLKPQAPAEYRGSYSPIQSSVPGLDVCELLPQHARIADRFSLIRSCHHEFSGHQDGLQHVLTGYPAVLTGGGTITSVYPELGCIFKKVRGTGTGGIPPYVAVGHRLEFVGPAYLGQGCQPFVAAGNPNDMGFQVPDLALPAGMQARLEDRRRLRQAFDRLRRETDRFGAMGAIDEHDRDALRLLTSAAVQDAFDISRIAPRERDRYGRSRAGQSALLARRLLEAGVGFVTVELSNYSEAGVDGGWDDHAGACDIFDRMNRRLPVYDRALCALIEDLYDRGLDRRVLMVVFGEFGRTPRINIGADGRPGREHWPAAMSVLVSGGGMRMGQVIGATDRKGEHPTDRPLRPVDLLATMNRFLGIDPRREFPDYSGRPRPVLPAGTPIAELLS